MGPLAEKMGQLITQGADWSRFGECAAMTGQVETCADLEIASTALERAGVNLNSLNAIAGRTDYQTISSENLCEVEQAFGATGSQEIPALGRSFFGSHLSQFNKELRGVEAVLQDSSLKPQEALEKAMGHLKTAVESFQKIEGSNVCSPNLTKRLQATAENIQKFAEEKGLLGEPKLVDEMPPRLVGELVLDEVPCRP